MTVTYENCSESEPHFFITEASSLQLQPGNWPSQLATTMGNGMPFLRTKIVEGNGELLAVIYRQANGCLSLEVFND